MNRIALLLVLLMSGSAEAVTISLDSSTTLLDSSTFTAGTTYYAVFQLTSSGTANTQASLSNFNLGGGTGLPQSGGDPLAGNILVGPDSSLLSGIWQPGGTLDLAVDPSNAFALYTQQFTAGTSFLFDFSLVTDLLPGGTPDQFAFQLYDSEISNLLYDVAVDAIVPADAPEPAAWSFALLGVAAVLIRKRGN